MLAGLQVLTCGAEGEEYREISNACCELSVRFVRDEEIRGGRGPIRGSLDYPFASSRSSGLPGYFPSAKRSRAAALSGSRSARRVLTASA